MTKSQFYEMFRSFPLERSVNFYRAKVNFGSGSSDVPSACVSFNANAYEFSYLQFLVRFFDKYNCTPELRLETDGSMTAFFTFEICG